MEKEVIDSLVDKVIKVDRGGPESRIGLLLAARNDYIALLHEKEGVIYYNKKHIKSLTYDSKNQVQLGVEIPDDFEFVQARDFKGTLKKLELRWVKINRGGPEALEGVMESVTDDFVTIVANEEIIRVSLFHIRNISYGVRVEKKEGEEKTEKQPSKND